MSVSSTKENGTNAYDEAPTNDAEAAPSLELNLRLDENGRTSIDPARVPSLRSASAFDPDAKPNCIDLYGDGDENPSKRAKTDCELKTVAVDYSSQTALTNLHDSELEEAMDALLFDCEITDCALLPRTFWIPAQGMKPRCFMEKLALDIFHHHASKASHAYYDPETSGAEWWVQIRPSPPAGRYSLLTDKHEIDEDDDMAKSGISFHWDKDEDLRLLCGGSMYIHPHLSTVTYLTGIGAPTMVLSKRVDPMTGKSVLEKEDTNGFVCWPRKGKHLSFDGRFLHAAPSDLMEDGMFDAQCKFEISEGMGDKEKKVLGRRHRRVTFLVNVWLNHRPVNVNPFPETMLKSMSSVDLFDSLELFGGSGDANDKQQGTNTSVHVTSEGAREFTGNNVRTVKLTKMNWPIGSCDDNEQIDIQMPLETIRRQAMQGSNVSLVWDENSNMISMPKLTDSDLARQAS